MSDPMRSLSVTVKLTPRQAVAAMRSMEREAAQSEDHRVWRARERVMFGLQDAGWKWDGLAEAWRLEHRALPDPIGDS